MTRGIIVGRRRLLEYEQEQRIHHACPDVADGEGEFVVNAEAGTDGRAAGEARKSVICGREEPSLADICLSWESCRAPLPDRVNR